MNTSSSMAPVLADYHKKRANLHAKILENEEQRILLDLQLRSLSNVDTRLKEREQTDFIQTYFTELDRESSRAKQRNIQLLDELNRAEIHLNQLRIDTDKLIRLKKDYVQYLESNYPDWQKQLVSGNVLLDADLSTSDSNSNTFSRSKRTGSLKMELSRTGLYFLLDYLEAELKDSIDKRKFYDHDSPTITQKRMILDIANEQQRYAIKDLEPTTTSIVVFDQLPSTIRRTTVHQCLLTEDILSLNVIDLNRDSIAKMLPEQDRSLWLRLIEHFTHLIKHHIMNAESLAKRFAPLLLLNNTPFLHEKAKSVLRHLLEKLIGTQQINSNENTSTVEKKSILGEMVKSNPILASPGLNKLKTTGALDDDESSSSSSSSSMTTTAKKNLKSTSSSTNIHPDDSELEFYS